VWGGVGAGWDRLRCGCGLGWTAGRVQVRSAKKGVGLQNKWKTRKRKTTKKMEKAGGRAN